MNAQVNQKTHMLDLLRDGTAKAIAAIKAAKQDSNKATGDRDTAVATVRNMAVQVAAVNGSPEAAKAAATYMAATMKAAGIAAGTITPYAVALRGFIYEAAAGKDIVKYTDKGEGKFNPLSVAQAQSIAQRAEMTDAEREAADAEAERLAIVADLSKRLRNMERGELIALRDSGLIPALDEAEEATESAADRRRREALEKAKAEATEAAATLAALEGGNEAVAEAA